MSVAYNSYAFTTTENKTSWENMIGLFFCAEVKLSYDFCMLDKCSMTSVVFLAFGSHYIS